MISGRQKFYQSRLSYSTFHSLLMVKNIVSLNITLQYNYASALWAEETFITSFTKRRERASQCAEIRKTKMVSGAILSLQALKHYLFNSGKLHMVALSLSSIFHTWSLTCHADRFSRRRRSNILPVQQLRASDFTFEFASSLLSSFFSLAVERGKREGDLASWERDLRSQFMENDWTDGTDCMQR